MACTTARFLRGFVPTEDATALLRTREALLSHPMYAATGSPGFLPRFMGSHVFAVWDFMCLTKALQRECTNLDTWWTPPANPAAARFINTIVTDEESDQAPGGGVDSHFGLYLRAMEEVAPGSSGPAKEFVAAVSGGSSLAEAQAALHALAPPPAAAFTANTLAVVARGDPREVAGYFFFGREDPIPAMFAAMLGALPASEAPTLRAYMDRHVELDGDHHGPAAQSMLLEMAGGPCTPDAIAMAHAGMRAVEARIALWDDLM